MKTVIKEFDSHGAMIACVEWWLNAGKYDTNNTAHGKRHELYRDGTVYERHLLWHRDQGRAYLRRKKVMTLDQAQQERASWQDFRDEWITMKKNQDLCGFTVVDVVRAKKD